MSIHIHLEMSFGFPFVPLNVIFIFPDMGIFAFVKRENQVGLQRGKPALSLIRLGERRQIKPAAKLGNIGRKKAPGVC